MPVLEPAGYYAGTDGQYAPPPRLPGGAASRLPARPLPCDPMDSDQSADEALTDTPAPESDGRTRPASEFLPLDRFTAFTDGVFAIAITLLVLELTVPALEAPLLPTLAEQWHEFLGYLISFVFIGGIWVAHAGMTKLMREADAIAYGIDLLMLLFVGLLPFSTELMVTHLEGPDVTAAVVIYGANLLVASSTLSLLMFYIASERSLVLDSVADDELDAKVRRRWSIIVLNVVAIAVAIVLPIAAVGLYLITTIVGLLLPLVRLRRRKR